MTRRGKLGIAVLSAALLCLSVVAVLRLPDTRSQTAFLLPWLVLVPLYVLALLLPVPFEFRGDAHLITFTQIPLVVGALLLTPMHQLWPRLLAVVAVRVLLQRQPPLKTLVNLAIAGVEVVAVAVGVLASGQHQVGPLMWLGLFTGVAAGDAVGLLVVSGVLRVAGVHRTRADFVKTFGFTGLTSLACTTVAVIVFDAMVTDPWTLLLVTSVGGMLAYAYRSYRHVLRQQEVTESLYDFVKDLGPLVPEDPSTLTALEQVRLLLHARTLDLALSDGPGQPWRHLVVSEGESATDPASRERILDQLVASGTASLHAKSPENEDHMAATVGEGEGLLGVVTAHGRLGDVRDFDRGDVRLLETIANELATALQRGALMQDLQRTATVDTLTGIPNLSWTTALVDDLVLRGDSGVVVAALCVDSFREVNDTLGHEVGDELLLEVARRLRDGFPEAVVGRIGGGRFAVAAPASFVGGDPSLFGLRLRSRVEDGTRIGHVGTHVRVSVGVARSPEDGREAGTLLRRAETAMYAARTGQGGPLLWEPAYEVRGQRRLAVVTALREALATGAIGMAYQPKVTAEGRRTTGVEALARWTHPALGSVPPDEFIPLAEASGLIAPLTTSVLKQSLTACKGWQRRAPGVGVAVNVCADTVLDPTFVTTVAALLTETGLGAGLLTLELTEGIAVADPDLAIERMRELRTLGVRISVDDFGTGYSSLTYLKSLPLDEVKIDKGFIDAITTDLADQAVVRAVIDIAHTRGLRVVAEGVEYEEQHLALLALGVDETQGYLHARPMPSIAVSAWMRDREPDRAVPPLRH